MDDVRVRHIGKDGRLILSTEMLYWIRAKPGDEVRLTHMKTGVLIEKLPARFKRCDCCASVDDLITMDNELTLCRRCIAVAAGRSMLSACGNQL